MKSKEYLYCFYFKLDIMKEYLYNKKWHNRNDNLYLILSNKLPIKLYFNKTLILYGLGWYIYPIIKCNNTELLIELINQKKFSILITYYNQYMSSFYIDENIYFHCIKNINDLDLIKKSMLRLKEIKKEKLLNLVKQFYSNIL